jgi:hypothetical protein
VGLTVVYTESTLLPLFKILNVKETLMIAERREEARLTFRIMMEIIDERVKPHFFIMLPFELRNGRKGIISKEQESLLDFHRNIRIGMSIEFGNEKYEFFDIEIEDRHVILKSQDRSMCIHVPKNEDFAVSEAQYLEFDLSASNVQSPLSLLHVQLANSLPRGLYFIKFYCYVRNFLGEIADYWIFEQGKILETPVWNNIVVKKQIIPSYCSEMIFDYLEFFVITPSRIAVSSVAPEGYESKIFTEWDEVEPGGVVDVVDPGYFDYKPYKGRNQYKWIFYPDSVNKFISLAYWPSSTLPILLLFVTLLLNFSSILFLISAAEKLLGIAIFTFLLILGAFNTFLYFSIMKPKIIQRIFLFFRIAGTNRIFFQIYGSALFFVLVLLIISTFCRYLKLEPSVIWSSLILGALLLALVLDVRLYPDNDMKRFAQVLIYRNAINIIVSLVFSVLILNIYIYFVSPYWTLVNFLSFFAMIFSFHVFIGKVSEIWGIRR